MTNSFALALALAHTLTISISISLALDTRHSALTRVISHTDHSTFVNK